jgi:hypothetical protein
VFSAVENRANICDVLRRTEYFQRNDGTAFTWSDFKVCYSGTFLETVSKLFKSWLESSSSRKPQISLFQVVVWYKSENSEVFLSMKMYGGEEVQLHAFLNVGTRWR